MLAERIDLSDEGRTYTFRLRDGVRFHNGQPLTSADVAFSFERYRRREVNWRCRPDLDSDVTRLTAVETPDPRTVVMRLEKPSALFLTTLARTDCGQTGSTIVTASTRTEPGAPRSARDRSASASGGAGSSWS
jgi:peptide/nickel transport system substrate-binding protein